MKKKLIILAGVGVLGAVALLLQTRPVTAAITGSLHDFSSQGWNPGGEICEPCHTPHNADITSTTDAPLWNHAVTASTFSTYTSSTVDATIGSPGGRSLLCLSCHDGTVALDSFGGAAGGTMLTGSALLGTDLRDDHPISFDYTAVAAVDTGIRPETDSTSLGGTIATDLLFGGYMECASCHDVHNKYGNASLLKIDNAASVLCLTCHDK